MNNSIKLRAAILTTLVFISSWVVGQEMKDAWTLRNCIDYALQNNIQVKKTTIAVENSREDYEQAKAGRFPTLNATAGESFTHQKAINGSQSGDASSFTGSYSLRTEATLYNGNRIRNSISLQENNVRASSLEVKVQENTIELAVTTAYLQVLYAKEAVTNAENTLSTSKAEMERVRILWEGGYIAESNYAQVEAQYSSDSYALVTAQNNLSQQLLSLKQLLELGIDKDLNLFFPELMDGDVLKPVPEESLVFNKAISFMPEVESDSLAMKSAKLSISIAKAGYMPNLSLSGSLSTGYDNQVSGGYATQLGDNFYQNAGLTLNIPIFNNRQVKSSVSKAKLGLETAKLNYEQTLKDLMSRVESAYLDAVSAQSRYLSAKDQLASTSKSYSLTEDQFNLGMKNTVDLLTEKNKFLSAQQEYLQAKYSAILSYKILDFYQQKRIDL